MSAEQDLNIAAIVRHARAQVCEAYFTGGHPAALAALAASSIRLYRYVRDGSLRGDVAHEMLWGVAENLTLIRALGEAAVAAAIEAGPDLYDELDRIEAA